MNLNNKWVWIGIGIVAFVVLMVWGVDSTMCKDAVC
jgi:hypothetical protein